MAVMGEGRRHREEGFVQDPSYAWSPGEFGRPKCWYRDVSDADKAAEVSWLRSNVMGPDQTVWALRIHGEGSVLGSMLGLGQTTGHRIGEGAADRPGSRWGESMKL